MRASDWAPQYSGARLRQGGRAVMALLCAAAVILVGAGAAHAAGSYTSTGSFGSDGSGPGQFSAPTRIAVDDATGDVLIVDSGNGRVDVYGPGGAAAAPLTDFGTGDLSSPYGIAIDQSTHAVYVTDSGNNRIVRYTSDGLPTPTYTQDLTYLSPALGSADGEVGSFASAIAIDPRNGDLLIADKGNQRVTRFPAGGGASASFTGADAPSGRFHSLSDLTVDAAGDIYVVDVTAGDLSQNTGRSVLERFSAAGASAGAIGPVSRPRTLAFDATTGNIVVASQFGFPPVPIHVSIFHDGVPVTAFDFPAGQEGSTSAGLAVDNGGSGRLYGLLSPTFGIGATVVQVFDPIVLPDVTLAAPTALTKTSVHLSGTVNPLGNATTWHFEYSVGDAAPVSTPGGDAGSGSATVPVDEDVNGLAPNTDFTVRLVGVSANGTISTPPQTFSTLADAPGVVTGSASDRSTTGATLHGTVNPFGQQTTYHFEYGVTTGYGSQAPAGHDAVAGDGRAPRQFTQVLSGLLPNTTYHYRLVARNAAGETAGDDRTFTTAAAPDGRAYELVSPVDKGGSNIAIPNDANGVFQAAPDGNSIVYTAKTALGGSAGSQSAPLLPKYATQRSATGWSAPLALDPPQQTSDINSTRIIETLGVSEDGSTAFVVSLRALAPGASEGDSNIYLHDTRSGAYTTIGTAPGPTLDSQAHFNPLNLPFLIGGTADYSHVLFGSSACCTLVPGTPNGGIYDWTGGHLRLVSVQPDGTPFADPANLPSLGERYPHRISKDGSTIFFEVDGSVYARIDGTQTVPISLSHRSADPPGTLAGGTFLGASQDGNVVYLDGADLTDDSSPGVPSVYRLNRTTDQLTLIQSNVPSTDVKQIAGDGTYVYFQSSDNLATGATAGVPNVYVWHGGSVAHVATLDPSRDSSSLQWYLASPSGRFFAVSVYSQLTDYDNSSTTACVSFITGDPGNSCREVYRYDADTGSLVCASCRPDGGPITGNASIGTLFDQLRGHFPPVMQDDGQVFFDAYDQLSAKDTNSGRDVYSFDGQQATLISAGAGIGDSRLADVAANGHDVFFTTQDQLVGKDTDTSLDLYDARVGGGIPSQTPDVPRGTCSGDGCRGAGSGPAAPTPAASEASPLSGFTPAKPGKAKLSLVTASFNGTILRLTVNVSGSGRIRASGSKVTTTIRSTSKAGTYRIQVPLSKRQRALRRAGHRVKANLVVSFTPAFGTHAVAKFTRTAAR